MIPRPRLAGLLSQVRDRRTKVFSISPSFSSTYRTNVLPPNEVDAYTPNNPSFQYVGVLLKS